ncbi:Uncharacterised protein [Streptococcus pneumoniae]|nr:Uncharacterised protein [Streptococcus pneumoniae]
MAKLVNLVIDRTILLNIGIARRDIGLWLVIIIVGYEILNCIFREKFLKLPIELTSQSFIVGNNQSWFIDFRNDLTHSIGLPCSSRPHQNLSFFSPLNVIHQLLDSLGLIS